MSKNTEVRDKFVIAAVIERGGRYLVCQRPSHKSHGGLWEFPGGKIESGETFNDAAARELKEELGLVVLDVGSVRLSLLDSASGFVINFVDVQVEGEPALLEHLALLWLFPHELDQIALAPSDRQFADYLLPQSRHNMEMTVEETGERYRFALI